MYIMVKCYFYDQKDYLWKKHQIKEFSKCKNKLLKQ